MSSGANDVIDKHIVAALSAFRNEEYQFALQQYTALISTIQKLTPQEISNSRTALGLSSQPVIGPAVHPKLPTILDLRAATYEKLGDLNKALRDGENLVKIDPLGCKGYLRHSKILLTMGKDIEAYKVVQKGVYTIDSSRKKYQITVPLKLLDNLKLRYKMLNDKLKADFKQRKRSPMSELPDAIEGKQIAKKPKPRALDPFLHLPLELMERVFKTVDLKSVFRLLLVCKKWYEWLTGFTSLFETISFKLKIDKSEFLNGMRFIEKIFKQTSTRLVKYIKLRSTLKQDFFLEALSYLSFKLHLKLCKLELINPHFSIGDLLVSIVCNKYNKPDEHGLRPFETLEMLRLGVSSQTRHIPHLVGLLANLKILEVIHLSENTQSTFEQSVYASADLLLDKKVDTLKSLHTLTHIGHPKREGGPVPLMKQVLEGRFPNLKSLTVVSQDLLGCSGTILSKLYKLQEIHFENNLGYDLITFMNNFIIEDKASGTKYAHLKKLVFRERESTNDLTLDGYTADTFPGFAGMRHLDLYNSSICRKGLHKMLEICNNEGQLRVLNIGGARRLTFPQDNFDRRAVSLTQNVINFKIILELVPQLTHLYIPELGFTSFAAKICYSEMQKYGFEKINLSLLDISYTNIDGRGLIDLFCVSNRQPVTFKLDELLLDGVAVDKGTLRVLESRGHVRAARNNLNKVKWREYGINSLIID